MNVDQFVSIISWALPLAAVAGAAFVWFRQAADKATIEALEKRVEVVNGLMEDQEKQHANDLRERDQKITSLTDQVEHVKQQNVTLARQVNTLQGVVTQAAEIAHLQETLDVHHGEAIEHWRSLLDKVEEIKEAMA